MRTNEWAASVEQLAGQIRGVDMPAVEEHDSPDTGTGIAIGTPISIGVDAATDSLSLLERADLFGEDHATLIGVAPPTPALHHMAAIADEDLMSAVTQGNHSALEQLYDRHCRLCFGLALKIVRDPSVAEVITQEVFFKIWSLPDLFFEQRGKFVPWLLTVAHHRSIDKLRVMSAGLGGNTLPLDAVNTADDIMLIDAMPDMLSSPHDSAGTNEMGRIVRDALRQLTEQQHEVISMAYFDGLTQSEIATKLNRPLGTVKTYTHSALCDLRESFISQGLLRTPNKTDEIW